ncbi:MAG: hypothetical protein V1798_05945 [Pseudomonadota bacterium]
MTARRTGIFALSGLILGAFFFNPDVSFSGTQDEIRTLVGVYAGFLDARIETFTLEGRAKRYSHEAQIPFLAIKGQHGGQEGAFLFTLNNMQEPIFIPLITDTGDREFHCLVSNAGALGAFYANIKVYENGPLFFYSWAGLEDPSDLEPDYQRNTVTAQTDTAGNDALGALKAAFLRMVDGFMPPQPDAPKSNFAQATKTSESCVYSSFNYAAVLVGQDGTGGAIQTGLSSLTDPRLLTVLKKLRKAVLPMFCKQKLDECTYYRGSGSKQDCRKSLPGACTSS